MIWKKWRRALVLVLAVTLCTGQILPVYASEPFGSAITEVFAANVLKNENTWLFAGCIETQGRFAEVGGARSYVGHFEEYIIYPRDETGDGNGSPALYDQCRTEYYPPWEPPVSRLRATWKFPP